MDKGEVSSGNIFFQQLFGMSLTFLAQPTVNQQCSVSCYQVTLSYRIATWD